MTRGKSSDSLIYPWSRERHFPVLSVPAMIVVSLALHAASFYFIQVAYPDAVSLRPPPAVVNLKPESLPGSEVDLHWLAGEDPTLLASWSFGQLPLPGALAAGDISSASQAAPMVRTLPAPPRLSGASLPDAVPPPRIAPGAVTRPTSPTATAPAHRPALEAVFPGTDTPPTAVPMEATGALLKSALDLPLPEALVRVDAGGRVGPVFVLVSSGSHETDSAIAGLLEGLVAPAIAPGWHRLTLAWRLATREASPRTPAQSPP